MKSMTCAGCTSKNLHPNRWEKDGNQTFLQVNREFQIFLYAKHVTVEAHLACVLKEALLIDRWGCFSCIWRQGNISNTVQTAVKQEHGALEKPRTNKFREHREGWRAVRCSWEEGPCSSLLHHGPTDSQPLPATWAWGAPSWYTYCVKHTVMVPCWMQGPSKMLSCTHFFLFFPFFCYLYFEFIMSKISVLYFSGSP